MPNITFIERNGTAHVLVAELGDSLMDIAVLNAVPGIGGNCGGYCGCATCHVYVDPDWLLRTGTVSAEEAALLAAQRSRKKNSRLCCQIKASALLDGLVVRIPA